jgi:hypothetical protein
MYAFWSGSLTDSHTGISKSQIRPEVKLMRYIEIDATELVAGRNKFKIQMFQ